MRRIAGWVDAVLAAEGAPGTVARVREEVRELCDAFPLLGGAAPVSR